MVSAPVGFHCPSCVAEAAARVPRSRTALGGMARAQPRRATQVIMGANVVVYILTLLTGDRLILEYGMFGAAVASGEWWRLLTAPFLHAGLWHVGLNMLALWVLGGVVEPLLGRWRFVGVYLVSALGGTVTSYVLTGPGVISVGASGAVFGLLGATLVVLRRLNRDVSGVVVLLVINVVGVAGGPYVTGVIGDRYDLTTGLTWSLVPAAVGVVLVGLVGLVDRRG